MSRISSLSARLTVLAVHPFVFAVFPALSLYSKNIGQGVLDEALGSAAVITVIVSLVWLGLWLVVKDKLKAANAVSASVVLFFSYGPVIAMFKDLFEKTRLADQAAYIFQGQGARIGWTTVWGVLVAAICYVTLRAKASPGQVNAFLNLVAVTGITLVGIRIIVGTRALRLRPPSVDQNTTTASGFEEYWLGHVAVEGSPSGAAHLPDIYYIIVDGYARGDILREVYGFDNSEFLSDLTERGFYVADASTANYPQTTLSLASSLNLGYLDDLVAWTGTETNNRQPLQTMIRNNKVFEYLRQQGYTILALASGYWPTELSDADVYLSGPRVGGDMSEFRTVLLAHTPLPTYNRPYYRARRSRITYAFDHLPDGTEGNGPVFVFAHILVPHWPFVFDGEGNVVDLLGGVGARRDYRYDEYIEGYTGQVQFVNRRLLGAIDEILAGSSEPPIIVVQADHGPDARLDYQGWTIEGSYLPERMSILNAYYFPDGRYDSLYESITPVNTFRVILNEYLGADLELVEDRSYFAAWNMPYSLTDVTDKVRAGE